VRVIHFVPYYPPERLGGVGEFAAALHEGLLRRGCESTVVTSGRRSGGSVQRIARTRLGWFLGTLRWARRAAACDVVHCQSGEALPVVLALRLMPRRRARILATFHVSNAGIHAAEAAYRFKGLEGLEGRRFGRPLAARLPGALIARLHRLVDALMLRLADALNTISRATAVDLLGPERGEAARVIYNGVAAPPAGEPDAAIAPAELFYAGLASHRKRVNALPFILREVRREIPDARLRIAGFELDEAPELRALFEHLELLAHVECLGRKTSAELPPYYRAAGVLVVPSAYEGLPYVILEAMQNGTPVVATRVSGHPEVIEDGRNGFLVNVDRPAALAARCVEILRDSALARRLAEAGRETIAHRFGLERQIGEYLDYYETLAKGKR
jgi:glycosyltransferase involved in cell wall biosynthesis